jgi:hypothetical protein
MDNKLDLKDIRKTKIYFAYMISNFNYEREMNNQSAKIEKFINFMELNRNT